MIYTKYHYVNQRTGAMNRLKRIIAICLVFTLIPVAMYYDTVTVKAAGSGEFRDEILDVTFELRRVLNNEYDEMIKYVKREAYDNDYDYTMTMQDFFEKGNPIRELDFVKMVAAYMSISKNYKGDFSVSKVPFISCECTQVAISYTLPTKVPVYKKVSGLDRYELYGYKTITTEETMPKYEKTTGNMYKKVGTCVVKPDTEDLNYGSTDFFTMEVDEFFKYFKLENDSKVKKDYQDYIKKIEAVTSSTEIGQNILAKVPDSLNAEDLVDTSGMTKARANVIKVAEALVGQIPYEWGGKSSSVGYDETWWTFNDKDGLQKGLDCSGFIQWVFRTAGYPEEICSNLLSTGRTIKGGFEEIKKDELKPGDVGLLNKTDKNHIGIYAGDGRFIHCSSAAGTVVCAEYNFNVFYRIIDDNDDYKPFDPLAKYTKDRELVTKYGKGSYDCSEEDVYLLAQLIYDEARGEGLNGWVAVGEVIKNRVDSDRFPNTVKEVITAKGQFTNGNKLSGIKPTSEMISVARETLSGRMKILDNKNVLFFRNPSITSGIAATSKVDWGTYKYFNAVGHHAFYTL